MVNGKIILIVRICGIYKLTNLINNKIYVGKSTNVFHRKFQHAYSARVSRNHNLHLKRAIIKHGRNNFIFSIIEFCPKEILDERETFWIKRLKTTNSNFGYNKTFGGKEGYPIEEVKAKIANTLRGRKRPQEVKDNLRKALKTFYDAGGAPWNKNKKLSEEQKQSFKKCSVGVPREENRTPVCLYSSDGLLLIKCFESQKQACKQLNIPRSSMWFYLSGNRKYKNGILKYKKENEKE